MRVPGAGVREATEEAVCAVRPAAKGTAKEVEHRLRGKPWDITVAVMGCVVNGPGEASHADFGIAGGKKEGVIFKKGVSVGRFPVATLADELCALIEREMA